MDLAPKRDAEHPWQVIDILSNVTLGWAVTENKGYTSTYPANVVVIYRPLKKKVVKRKDKWGQ